MGSWLRTTKITKYINVILYRFTECRQYLSFKDRHHTCCHTWLTRRGRHLNTKLTFMRWYRNWIILWNALVFHLCVSLPCDVTSWILTTVTCESYWSLVTVIVSDSCFHGRINRKDCDLIHGRYNLYCLRNSINLLGLHVRFVNTVL